MSLREAHEAILVSLRGALVVSCQAYPGEPLNEPGIMPLVAQSVVGAGAAAVRMQGLADIEAAADSVAVPVIGLVKEGATGVYITPTLELARAVADAGAAIVALDGTQRDRPDGLTLAQTIAGLRETHDVLVMADCDCLVSALSGVEAGADIVGTTLAGYTRERATSDGPDVELVQEIVAALPEVPVFAEGRIRTPDDLVRVMAAGAHTVVVGGAITHPASIAQRFLRAAAEARTGLGTLDGASGQSSGTTGEESPSDPE